ncbi:MAG: hypothetical protein K9I82_15385 [Chitinophagaceae bacterium]|nr:hypothetical protein [Chitinophagaceae bacterium]
MNDLFEQTLLDRINLAKLEKDGKNKERINLKLSELQEYFALIDQKKQSIVDENTYQRYIYFLKDLIKNTVEQIMAPTVDEFINWINEITTEKNHTNTNRLRTFLVEHYADLRISESIESINSNKAVLEFESSIFNPLLKDITKELKRQTENLLKDPAHFENNIDDYFEKLTTTLNGFESIQELQYTKIDQLYSDNQKASNIEFYCEFIKAIIDKGQRFELKNESEKTQSIISKVENRILEIKKGVSILHNSKIALSQDELLKSIFLKLDKEVNYEKGISNALNQFIDETWSELEDYYNKIKNFFIQPISVPFNLTWNSYSKKGGLISIIDEYNNITNENVLLSISNKSTDDTKKILKAKAKIIDRYNVQQGFLKSEIEEEFNSLISEFEAANKKHLLENLSSNDPELLIVKQKINDNIDGLKAGVLRIKEEDNVILFLRDYFTSTFNCYNEIRSGFEYFLQESGMSNHLLWLDSKCDGSLKGSITPEDLNDPILLKELLEKGLIKIEIEKTF